MNSSFSAMKRSSSASLDRLTKEINKLANPESSQKDDRFWYPDVDKAGNGYAIIRFLPAVNGEDMPWVWLWSHGFQGSGGWYIENSLTTLGQQDPVSELNSKLWNSGNESDKEIARKRKRKLTYISNILVVKDPANPSNEGQVFLYKYGKKIFDKLNEVMNPQFADETKMNPFDLWAGANLKLKIRNIEGYRNYDKSEFDSISKVFDDEEQMEEVWKKEYPLAPLVDASNFKSYDDLKKRLTKVLSEPSSQGRSQSDGDTEPKISAGSTAAPSVGKSADSPKLKTVTADDDLSFFEKLAEDA